MSCEINNIYTNDDELIDILISTKSIAIIGCSPNENKDSHKVAKYLLEAGYTIYPVYPKEDIILGQKVYRSLDKIPHKVDMVDIFRKAKIIENIVDVCISKGDIDTIWSQLGLVNNQAMEKARKHNIKTIQNLCTKLEHKRLI
ncbi:MAG: CoA-binding protein [Epsilonproteobacteria bacterium]|nr:MAG: CoA-binding protein [Campylobacterota bacterium]